MPLDGQEKANEKALSKGGKVRLLSLGDLDRRTRAAGYAEDTRNAIVADLGGDDALSTLERIQAENLAVTSAVLRDMQAQGGADRPERPGNH